MTTTVVFSDGTVEIPATLVTAKVRDAQYAVCRTCGVMPPCPYWGPAKIRGLHQQPGHRVDLMAVQTLHVDQRRPVTT